MSVVTKAIELLGYFSAQTPEIGLSQLCRRAGRDKATTYRYLSNLEAAGFVEQNPLTKAYRIGPAVLPLAQLREATVPRRAGAQAALRDLAEATGETSHVAVLSGHALHALVDHEPTVHSTRAVIDLRILPLHATASGSCALAFGPAHLMEAAHRDLTQFTPQTNTTQSALEAAVALTRASGFGNSDRSLETDIHGIAAPVFDQTGLFAGTVAVASVASRLTPQSAQDIRRHLMRASKEITRNWGGEIPAWIDALWQASVQETSSKEPAA
ncbi:MAG: DNA-binding IclR family transcriptional regulator [Sulfitobacter sp.]|jgi:IclR family transcriptional regulator, KDG regulon repressor